MPDGRSRILLVAGLVLAAATGVLLYTSAATPARAGVTGPDATERVSVVVARADIPPQTAITAEMVETRAFPADLVPAGAAADLAVVVGKRLSVSVPKGLPVVSAYIAGAAGQGGRPAIDPGRVLYSFQTNDYLTSAGLIRAGDRIDLLGTVAAGGDKVTQTLVQDIEVVQVLGGTREQPARSLAFVVDRQTALILKYLRDSGAAIDVVLRASADPGARSTRPVDIKYLIREFGILP